MKNKLNIYYITGTRADYGLMRHTLQKIEKHFSLSLVVVGMHLLKEFGNTITEIEKDKIKISAKIKVVLGNTGSDMSSALGDYVVRMTKFFSKNRPDLILVLGDRAEALAGAIVGAYINIPVVHVHGGDQGDDGANIDDSVRHSITKFVHIHLPATKKSAERIIKMGEEPWRVNIVGAPSLVELRREKLYSKDYIQKKFGIDCGQPVIMVLQHPVSTQSTQAAKQMLKTLEAIASLKLQTVLIYPNADAGSKQMINVIKKYEKLPFLQTYKSLPRKEYLSLMKYSSAMIGNSSSGTIDAPFFHLPVINVGIRESTREHAQNKIFVGHNKQEIIKAAKKAIYDKRFIDQVKKRKSPYGKGDADLKIVSVIKRLFPLSQKNEQRLLSKRLIY